MYFTYQQCFTFLCVRVDTFYRKNATKHKKVLDTFFTLVGTSNFKFRFFEIVSNFTSNDSKTVPIMYFTVMKSKRTKKSHFWLCIVYIIRILKLIQFDFKHELQQKGSQSHNFKNVPNITVHFLDLKIELIVFCFAECSAVRLRGNDLENWLIATARAQPCGVSIRKHYCV